MTHDHANTPVNADIRPGSGEWTYFVQSVDGGPIKIGFTSKDPEERLRALQVGSPTKLRIVGLVPGNREKELHDRFVGGHSHGEWFTPSKALLAFIDAEASSHLTARLATKARLRLEETVVPVVHACRQEVSASHFDRVFANDEELTLSLLEYCDWDEGEVVDEGDDQDETESVSGCIASMAAVCEEAGTFVEGVGVNADAGTVGFLCGPCNSGRRMDVLRELGALALEVDSITGGWFFFAVFWDRGQQIGVDLLTLATTGGKNNCHLFDPKQAGRIRGTTAQ